MPSDTFKDFLLDQLAEAGNVVCKSMFGGFGLYLSRVFFGIVYQGRFYLKTDDASRPAFVKRGSTPFRPKPGMTLSTYYEVPVEVVENRAELAQWARRAAAIGATSKKKPKRPEKKKPAKAKGSRRR